MKPSEVALSQVLALADWPTAPQPPRSDLKDVALVVVRYALEIGCSVSGAIGAAAKALREPVALGTIHAVSTGKRHADVLLDREKRAAAMNQPRSAV